MVLPSFGGGVKDTVAEEATGESTYSLEETQSQLEQMLSEIEGVLGECDEKNSVEKSGLE